MRSLSTRLIRLEEDRLAHLRDEYQRRERAQEDVFPVIKAVIEFCLARGRFAPVPAWFFHVSDGTPKQLAYLEARIAEMTPVLNPWLDGKGTL